MTATHRRYETLGAHRQLVRGEITPEEYDAAPTENGRVKVWNDLDDVEQAALVMVANGNISRHRSRRSHRSARRRLAQMGLVEWQGRTWRATPAGRKLARSRNDSAPAADTARAAAPVPAEGAAPDPEAGGI